MSGFPYEDKFEVHRGLPEEGTEKETVLAMLATMSSAENPAWETGQVSGTMYCGDHDHYDFLNEAFSYFSYVNSLQRDLCPSNTKFEAEIIAMTLDLLGAKALSETTPVGSGHLRWIEFDRPRGAGVSRTPPDSRSSEHHQAGDGAPGVLQSRSSLWRRSAGRARRSGDHAG